MSSSGRGQSGLGLGEGGQSSGKQIWNERTHVPRSSLPKRRAQGQLWPPGVDHPPPPAGWL